VNTTEESEECTERGGATKTWAGPILVAEFHLVSSAAHGTAAL